MTKKLWPCGHEPWEQASTDEYCPRCANARIAALVAETEERASTILDLQQQAERPKCFYCSFGESATASFEQLQEHIEKDCQRHPIRDLKEKIAALEAEVGRYKTRIKDLHRSKAEDLAPFVALAKALQPIIEEFQKFEEIHKPPEASITPVRITRGQFLDIKAALAHPTVQRAVKDA